MGVGLGVGIGVGVGVSVGVGIGVGVGVGIRVGVGISVGARIGVGVEVGVAVAGWAWGINASSVEERGVGVADEHATMARSAVEARTRATRKRMGWTIA